MTPAQRKAVRLAIMESTQKPWHVGQGEIATTPCSERRPGDINEPEWKHNVTCRFYGAKEATRDARAFVICREQMPAALEEIERLESLVHEYREQIDSILGPNVNPSTIFPPASIPPVRHPDTPAGQFQIGACNDPGRPSDGQFDEGGES